MVYSLLYTVPLNCILLDCIVYWLIVPLHCVALSDRPFKWFIVLLFYTAPLCITCLFSIIHCIFLNAELPPVEPCFAELSPLMLYFAELFHNTVYFWTVPLSWLARLCTCGVSKLVTSALPVASTHPWQTPAAGLRARKQPRMCTGGWQRWPQRLQQGFTLIGVELGPIQRGWAPRHHLYNSFSRMSTAERLFLNIKRTVLLL